MCRDKAIRLDDVWEGDSAALYIHKGSRATIQLHAVSCRWFIFPRETRYFEGGRVVCCNCNEAVNEVFMPAHRAQEEVDKKITQDLTDLLGMEWTEIDFLIA